MTEIERQVLETRIVLAENRSLLADARSQLALHVATALRDVLAQRSPQFDAEYVKQLASMPALSVPSADQLDSSAKLMQVMKEFETIRANLESTSRPEGTEASG